MTNYRKAWIDFRKTDEYKNCQKAMKAKGIKPPYSTNIIQNAFAAGWRATNTKIDFI